MTNGGYNLVLCCDCKKCREARKGLKNDGTLNGIDAVYIADGNNCRENAFKQARENGWRFTRGRTFCYREGHKRDTIYEQEILSQFCEGDCPTVTVLSGEDIAEACQLEEIPCTAELTE